MECQVSAGVGPHGRPHSYGIRDRRVRPLTARAGWCLIGSHAGYQSNFTPTRISRGAMMVIGRSHEAPELTEMFCSALLFVRL